MIVNCVALAGIGFGISLYLYLIEQKLKKEPGYKAACDINDRISCTKAMKSKYAGIFNVSNALLGMGYYLIVGILAFLGASHLLLLATIAGCICSAVLAYLLFFKIKTVCLMCCATYVINILLLVFAVMVR
jgi:vitamin-K-epoxide reductase (warfarin-sensitive)